MRGGEHHEDALDSGDRVRIDGIGATPNIAMDTRVQSVDDSEDDL